MLRFPVSPRKVEDLRRRMAALELHESDFVERFFCPNLGRVGKRHAKIAVQLYHAASKTEVRCFKSTSQALNRFLARRLLVKHLEKANEQSDLTEKPRASSDGSGNPIQHMHRMFTQSFERDIAQPYPIPAQKLLGIGNLPAKLIGIHGERESQPKGQKGNRRLS